MIAEAVLAAGDKPTATAAIQSKPPIPVARYGDNVRAVGLDVTDERAGDGGCSSWPLTFWAAPCPGQQLRLSEPGRPSRKTTIEDFRAQLERQSLRRREPDQGGLFR